jgi:hypothetical protein
VCQKRHRRIQIRNVYSNREEDLTRLEKLCGLCVLRGKTETIHSIGRNSFEILKQEATMQPFRQGDRVEIYRKSDDENWEQYMEEYIGFHGFVTDPDTVINDPQALVRITLDGTGGTHRFPQDCLRKLEES